MPKAARHIAFLAALILFTGCGNPLEGYWMITEIDGIAATRDIAFSEVWQMEGDQRISYRNNPCDDTYHEFAADRMKVSSTGNTYEGHGIFDGTFELDGEVLIIKAGPADFRTEYHLEAYEDEFPPASWVANPQDSSPDNADRNAAYSLTVDGAASYHFLHEENLTEWFAFEAEAQRSYTIEMLHPDVKYGIAAELYGPDTQKLETWDSYDALSNEFKPFTWSCPADGTYTMKLTISSIQGCTPYSLKISAQ